MAKELTVEEKRAKADAHDALIKHVFDSLRNLTLSVTLAVSGGAVLRYRAELPFGSAFNLVISILVVIASIGLFLWNMYYGIEKLIRPVKGMKKAWRLLPFTVVYVFTFLAIFQAGLRTQTEQQLRAANTKPTPNSSASPQSGSRSSP
jgi:hypothetical protein